MSRFDVEALKDRIHEHFLNGGVIEVDPLTGCWIFVGGWDENGFGIMRINTPDEGTKVKRVHRLSAWIYLGGFELNDRGVSIVQSCGNPACICFEHLEVRRRKAGSMLDYLPLFDDDADKAFK